tara:strand:+ start:146 stop:313 length:168 start_codon:yes stop_codon:yes gene_type:complete
MDKDVVKNIAVNGTAIGVSFTELETALRFTALLLGIAYTLFNFYVAYKKNKNRIK